VARKGGRGYGENFKTSDTGGESEKGEKSAVRQPRDRQPTDKTVEKSGEKKIKTFSNKSDQFKKKSR